MGEISKESSRNTGCHRHAERLSAATPAVGIKYIQYYRYISYIDNAKLNYYISTDFQSP